MESLCSNAAYVWQKSPYLSQIRGFLLVREAGVEPAKILHKPLICNRLGKKRNSCVAYHVISRERKENPQHVGGLLCA